MEPKQPAVRRINVSVDDTRLAIIAPVEHERAYRIAGEELTRTVQIYRRRYPKSSEIPGAGYLAMAAIDVAFRKRMLEQQIARLSLRERLLALNERAERLLGLGDSSVQPPETLP